MTKKEAKAEATRRWLVPNPAGGAALVCAFAFLGHKSNPMRFQVGRIVHDESGRFLHSETLGVSTQSWEDAFFNADKRTGATP